MDTVQLVNEQIEAGARFLQEFGQYVPVDVAFWMKPSDEREWFLHAASRQVTDDNFDLAYGEVARIVSERPDPWLDPFQIKVIGADDPLAKAVFDLATKFAAKSPIRLDGSAFRGMGVEAVLIYPLPAPVRS